MKEKTSWWFKIFAVCLAVGLGGTYVWRQQPRSVSPIDKTVEPAVLSGAKSESVAPTPPPADLRDNDPFMTRDSKSAGILTPEQQRTLMPSSKVGIFELQPGEEKKRVLMPGSKSMMIVPKEPETTPPPNQPEVDEP